MKPRVSALIACVTLSTAVGCGDGDREIAAVAGETLSVDLGGEAAGETALPAGAIFEDGRLTWTPAVEQAGEHVLRLDVVREDGAHPIDVVIVVREADGAGPISYGGCECGSSPRPPKPRGDVPAALVGFAAWAWRRRAAIRDA